MYRRVAIVLVGILVAVGASVGTAAAQDPVTVGPDIYKCTFENGQSALRADLGNVSRSSRPSALDR